MKISNCTKTISRRMYRRSDKFKQSRKRDKRTQQVISGWLAFVINKFSGSIKDETTSKTKED